MPGVAVVTDSTCSLSPRQVERADLRVIPLQVVLDGLSRPEGQVGAAEVAAALRAGRRVSTSRPSPEAFVRTYADLAAAGYAAVVSVHLSGRVSGTAEAAAGAAALAPLPVTVVDTRVLAMATGFAALAGADAAAAGADAVGVADVVARRSAASATYFCVDSLEHLRRGGRITAAAALLGSALAVKPLLAVSDGVVRPLERVRTASRARARLADLALAAVAEAVSRGRRVEVAVHHLDDEAGATALVRALADRPGVAGAVVLAELSAVLGVHVGPGTVGVVVSPSI